FAVCREAVGVGIGIWQFGGIAHADQIRRDQPAASLQFGNDIAPQIGRGRIAMQKQHRRAFAALVIGDVATWHLDGLFCERLFCHWFLASQIEPTWRATAPDANQCLSPSPSPTYDSARNFSTP